jgi:hypothetical protein
MGSEAPRAEASAKPTPTPAPYPGPRPFGIDEAQLFFGRDREASQFCSLVLGHSLVLLYAESGAGKTSLVNAGVIPTLRAGGATVFPSLRIRPSSPSAIVTASKIPNPYVGSLVTNWAAEQEQKVGDVRNLKEFIALLSRAHDGSPNEPRVFIVDQFEELFTQYPASWEQRGDFFVEVQQALDANPGLRVVLAMREDYIAQTDPYVGTLENRLQHRYRIDRLRRDPALGAVVGPLGQADRKRHFAEGAAEYLVDELLKIWIESGGKRIEVPGQFAEPVQLQIVCSSLWDRIEALPERVDEITIDHIKEHAPVKRALANFYGELVQRAADQAGVDVIDLRRWCEAELITEGRTRALVYRGPEVTRGMQNSVVDLLEGEHLIRREERSGASWYELSHDKFVDAIESGNRRAYEEHARLVKDLGAQADPLVRRVDDALDRLTLDADKASRLTAMGSIYTVVVTGVPLPSETRWRLESLLDQLIDGTSVDAETGRMAAYLKSLLSGSFDEELAFRTTYAGVRIATVDRTALSIAGGILAALLALSLVFVAEGSARLISWWWPGAGDLAIRRVWPIAVLAVLWMTIYVLETYENFPIESWRRSSRPFLHTLSAPVAPLDRQGSLTRPWYLALPTWPLNLVVPWLSAAVAAGATSVSWDWPYTLVFLVVLAATTITAVFLYMAAEF